MSQLAKQSLMVVFVAITLVIVFVGFLLANNSLAWFSNNKNVTASGLSMQTKVSPNLIIGKSEAQLELPNVLFAVDFEGTARSNMIAVTRDETVEGTYLKYLADHYAVDHVTGNAKEGMELAFKPVPISENEQYFIDYTVYIASAFDPLAVSSLAATISIPEEVNELHPYFNAVSIDFYVGEVGDEGYRGTTAVAYCVNDIEDKATVELLPGGGTVPLNTTGNIKVIMRCYFDGALQDPNTNHAYINSYTVRADNVVIGVDFTAVETPAAE